MCAPSIRYPTLRACTRHAASPDAHMWRASGTREIKIKFARPPDLLPHNLGRQEGFGVTIGFFRSGTAADAGNDLLLAVTQLIYPVQ